MAPLAISLLMRCFFGSQLRTPLSRPGHTARRVVELHQSL
jgi:hypothetical protein